MSVSKDNLQYRRILMGKTSAAFSLSGLIVSERYVTRCGGVIREAAHVEQGCRCRYPMGATP